MGMASRLLSAATLVLLSSATRTPLPGPKCAPGTPIANQSGAVPECRQYLQHNASCSGSVAVEHWALRSQFHVGSACHGENDPNGLVYHNRVYHVFFQDHVEGGTVGGHLATHDFISWKRLPVALWNDEWYDKSAVWTFSATVVEGVPTLIYPGIATPNSSLGDCGGRCMTHNVALPADPADPWLTDWVKPQYNPVILGTNRDPSTAWRTAAGEWRYTSITKDIYSSWDFQTWKIVGSIDSFGGGECPDFFPLPSDCDACVDSSNNSRPTHVHVTKGYQFGAYEDGAPNSTGTWSPVPGKLGKVDGSDPEYFYAAKSFWDPLKGRRIMWGWLRLGSALQHSRGFKAGRCPGVGAVMVNTNSLPREVRYDPLLQQLLFFPLEEMKALRDTVIAQSEMKVVTGRWQLTALTKQVAQSEIKVSFAIPTAATKFGVSVMTGAFPNGSKFGIDLFVEFKPLNRGNTWSVQAGYDSSSMTPGLRSSETLTLKSSDKTIDLSIWIDNVVAEVFFMGGRAAWTVPLPCAAIDAAAKSGTGIDIFNAKDAITVKHATVWSMRALTYHT